MNVPSRRRLIVGGGLAAVAGGALVLSKGFVPFAAGFEELPPAPVFAVGGLAIRGIDPVGYFRDRRPVVGEATFEIAWNGARWRFASAANRDAFGADPEAFAPRYGGFCAWAVAAKGMLYSTQPQNWSIVEGRLYLNFNDEIQRRWEADIPGFIATADLRWPELIRPA